MIDKEKEIVQALRCCGAAHTGRDAKNVQQ